MPRIRVLISNQEEKSKMLSLFNKTTNYGRKKAKKKLYFVNKNKK